MVELEHIADIIWPGQKGWMAKLARELGVARSTVVRWRDGTPVSRVNRIALAHVVASAAEKHNARWEELMALRQNILEDESK